jgi:hypothetical protein
MADEREAFAAFSKLPSTARAMLAILEQSIGPDTSVKLTKYDFVRHGIPRGSWNATKKRLTQLGFITVEAGSPNGVAKTANSYRLSERWRDVSEAQAKLLVRVPRRRRPRVVRAMKLAKLAQQAEAAPRRRHFGDDVVARRLAEGARARPGR